MQDLQRHTIGDILRSITYRCLTLLRFGVLLAQPIHQAAHPGIALVGSAAAILRQVQARPQRLHACTRSSSSSTQVGAQGCCSPWTAVEMPTQTLNQTLDHQPPLTLYPAAGGTATAHVVAASCL